MLRNLETQRTQRILHFLISLKEVRSASYTKREVNLTSMNLTVDKQGREEEYFLKEYTNSSEWGVINVHKVSLSVKERRVVVSQIAQ